MKKYSKLILPIIVCLIPILIGLAIYDKLPEQMPSHFNFKGEVDGYSSKNFGVFGLPLMMAGFTLLVSFALNTDPKRKNYSPALKAISLWLCPGLSVGLSLLIYTKALGKDVPISTIVMVFVALIYLVMGIFLPKVKRNYTMGIKLPWTLDSDENWDKTHKFGGKIWIIAGIILLINVFIKSKYLFLAPVFVSILAPIVYSYLLYRKTKGNNTSEPENNK